MLVLPGGGYGHISNQEGGPVAGWFNSIGISAVVLEYSVTDVEGPGTYPRPQQQALYTMRWLRAHAASLNIDPNKIGVIGFSAGGHLAACVSHGFERAEWLLDPDQSLERISARPDLSILAYAPLAASTIIPERPSMQGLLGPEVTSAMTDPLGWDTHVHPNAPETFLWHTAADPQVDAVNSYQMAIALQNAGIPHELHSFPEGGHGLGLVSIGERRQGAAEQWRPLAERWLRERGF